MKKNDANRKNRRKNKNIPKPKDKVKKITLASLFVHGEDGKPLLRFPDETEALFQKALKMIIERNKNKEQKNK